MSKHLDLALAESTEDEETEEYFATNAQHSHIPPRRSRSRNRVETNVSDHFKAEMSLPLHEEEEEHGHHSPDQKIDDSSWIGREESQSPNTPFMAYLNAFFMTIATVLVC